MSKHSKPVANELAMDGSSTDEELHRDSSEAAENIGSAVLDLASGSDKPHENLISHQELSTFRTMMEEIARMRGLYIRNEGLHQGIEIHDRNITKESQAIFERFEEGVMSSEMFSFTMSALIGASSNGGHMNNIFIGMRESGLYDDEEINRMRDDIAKVAYVAREPTQAGDSAKEKLLYDFNQSIGLELAKDREHSTPTIINLLGLSAGLGSQFADEADRAKFGMAPFEQLASFKKDLE